MKCSQRIWLRKRLDASVSPTRRH